MIVSLRQSLIQPVISEVNGPSCKDLAVKLIYSKMQKSASSIELENGYILTENCTCMVG